MDLFDPYQMDCISEKIGLCSSENRTYETQILGDGNVRLSDATSLSQHCEVIDEYQSMNTPQFMTSRSTSEFAERNECCDDFSNDAQTWTPKNDVQQLTPSEFLTNMAEMLMKNGNILTVSVQPPAMMRFRYESEEKRLLSKRRHFPITVTYNPIDSEIFQQVRIGLEISLTNVDGTILHPNELRYYGQDVTSRRKNRVVVKLTDAECKMGSKDLSELSICVTKWDKMESNLYDFDENDLGPAVVPRTRGRGKRQLNHNIDLKQLRFRFRLVLEKDTQSHKTNIKTDSNVIKHGEIVQYYLEPNSVSTQSKKRRKKSQGQGSQYQGSQYQGSEGQGSEGQGSEGQGSQYQGSQYQGSQGQGSQYQGSQYQGSEGQGSEGQGSEGQGSQYQGSQYQGSQYQGSQYQGSQYQGSQYQGSQYQGSQYQGSQYQGSQCATRNTAVSHNNRICSSPMQFEGLPITRVSTNFDHLAMQ